MDKCQRCGDDILFRDEDNYYVRYSNCGMKFPNYETPRLYLGKYLIYFYPRINMTSIYLGNNPSSYNRIRIDGLKWDISLEYIENLYLLK